eukprot:Skav201674  [mRNA]  locus=scaffold641:372360:386890:+ [translate_table: standard]
MAGEASAKKVKVAVAPVPAVAPVAMTSTAMVSADDDAGPPDEDVPYSLIEKLQESGINAADLKKLKDRFRPLLVIDAGFNTSQSVAFAMRKDLLSIKGLSDQKVIYIDTEGTFRPERVRQIAEAKGVAADAAMDNIVYARSLAPPRPEFQLTNEVPLPGSSAPAEFQLTEAQVQQCRAPLMPGMEMYLTPVGYSMLGGQWGSWQLTDSPDAPATASWRLNFMSSDWRTVHIKAEGNLSALATPVEILGMG